MARDVGVSQQQIVKYEKGIGRIPADSLVALCRTLQLDPTTLFYPLAAASESGPSFAETPTAPFEHEVFADRDTVTLVRAFQSIADKRVRKKVLGLVQAMADAPPSPSERRKGMR